MYNIIVMKHKVRQVTDSYKKINKWLMCACTCSVSEINCKQESDNRKSHNRVVHVHNTVLPMMAILITTSGSTVSSTAATSVDFPIVLGLKVILKQLQRTK